ncbi:biotin--[acetyl-CoA-carboxylase] ligase [Hyphomonas sp.]|uniref:biotin--[acetyl-CoA-carboxylase] ligase n=1 Tax=Hyphomonas sp. TaxID=87 RepID=UPI0030FAB0B0
MSLDWPVHHLGAIDSTNTEAKRRASAGAFADGWLVAETQSAGRGRLQRNWVSPVGNLFATALFHEPGGMAVASRLPFAAALAVSDVALLFAPGADIRLKWPNDVRIHGAKMSGILIETGGSSVDTWVAAGIGINVTHAPDGAEQSATSIATLRGDAAVTADMVLEALRKAFSQRLSEARAGFSGLRKAWLDRAEGLGATVRVTASGEPVEGVFEDLDEFGALILRLPDGVRQTIRAGDVNLVGRA